MSRNDELTDLGNLPREFEPPTELEERVVAALREDGLIEESRRPPARSVRLRWAMAAAFVVAALGGWVARGLVDSAPAPPVGTREYLLLLTEPSGLATDKSLAELVSEYREWGRRMGEEGRLVAARRLLEGGRRLSGDGADVMPLSAKASQLEATGFFLVRADSWEDAVALAKDGPHLVYGGEISLREVASNE